MNHDEIIERIKKLLRLARSSNRHEADLALAKAMELAREHGIEVESLDADAEPRRTTHCYTDATARLSYDRRYASTIVGRFFRVKPIHCACLRHFDRYPPRAGIKIAFVGTATDCEIALYVYGFLLHRFAWCWRNERGRLRNRHSFVNGMYHGIFQKLLELEPERPAHVVKGTEIEISNRHYIAQQFGPTESVQDRGRDPTANTARYRGYLAGRNTEFRSAIKTDSSAPLALA